MNRTLRITTATDSVYTITERDNSVFTVRGENTPSMTSQPLGAAEWFIKQPSPWPPQCGQQLEFISTYFDADFDTPLRMPGGGKVTSPVRLIQPVEDTNV